MPCFVKEKGSRKKRKKKKDGFVPSTGIEPVTFRYMIFQLQPNVIANYTTRGFFFVDVGAGFLVFELSAPVWGVGWVIPTDLPPMLVRR